ncbi:hypothetical protein LQZ18_08610 [Lachnospiraceae bacterium ZAX-1]
MKKILLILLLVASLFLTACANSDSVLKGKSLKNKDGPLLVLEKDNTFRWRLDPVSFENPQYCGTYQVYQAQSAVKFLTENFADYGLTEDAINEKIAERNCSLDHFYCLVFTNKEFLKNDENTLDQEEKAYWYGYFFDAYGQLDLVNVHTEETADFTITNY